MLRNIRLQNYRSYKDESFEFGEHVNILVGPNASGKTNLLEALQVILTGESYRSKDLGLIRYGTNKAKIEATTVLSDRSVIITKISEASANKKLIINDHEVRRIKLEHTLPLVLFEPNDLALISGSPDVRRDYLDKLLERTLDGYRILRQQYTRALQQRNNLLKKGVTSQEKLFPWNIRLSELGGSIANYRMQVVEKLAQRLGDVYNELASKKVTTDISYQSLCDLRAYSSSLLQKLDNEVQVDALRGYTGSGPHRDDFVVRIKDEVAQKHASRGEARTIVLSLKVIELELIKDARGKAPIMLLDDVFSELDGARRRSLTNYLQDYQTFITTTDADAVVEGFMKNSTILPLS